MIQLIKRPFFRKKSMLACQIKAHVWNFLNFFERSSERSFPGGWGASKLRQKDGGLFVRRHFQHLSRGVVLLPPRCQPFQSVRWRLLYAMFGNGKWRNSDDAYWCSQTKTQFAAYFNGLYTSLFICHSDQFDI